jgi:hypothetical protein
MVGSMIIPFTLKNIHTMVGILNIIHWSNSHIYTTYLQKAIGFSFFGNLTLYALPYM